MKKPADLLLSEANRRELKALMPAFQGLPPNDAQRAYLAAAWTFSQVGDVEEALKLVDLCTPEYIRDVMPGQMKADHTFDTMVEQLVRALLEHGMHVPSYIAPDGLYVMKRVGEA